MSCHRAGPSRLLVSRFRHESLRDGQTAQVGNQPEFWDNLRERINFTVVDTPAASQSIDGLVTARLPDMVVLVVAAEATRLPVIAALRHLITSPSATLHAVVRNTPTF